VAAINISACAYLFTAGVYASPRSTFPRTTRRVIELMVRVLSAPSQAARTFSKCSGHLQLWQSLLVSVATSLLIYNSPHDSRSKLRRLI
jgi:hypothetical protein